jgi:iron complex outermembrane receptor protein
VTVGGRYTSEKKDASVGIIGDPNATGGCAAQSLGDFPAGTTFADLDAGVDMGDCQQPFQDDENWSNFAPKLGLTWSINDDTIAFASYTRGFRSGGYNVRFTSFNPIATPGPYDEEIVDAFEVGLKTTLMDRRLRVNTSVFQNEYDDLQRTALDANGQQATINAASATVRGVEVETTFLVTEQLVLEANFGWTDARYDEFAHAEQATGLDSDAINFLMTPEFNSSISTTYSMPMGEAGDLDFRLSYSFVNQTFGQDYNRAPISQYELWDASVSFFSSEGGLNVSLFGRNLKDEVYFNFGTDFSGSSVLGIKSFWLTPPRTFGLQVTYEL